MALCAQFKMMANSGLYSHGSFLEQILLRICVFSTSPSKCKICSRVPKLYDFYGVSNV
jgi:hypothetical protein